MKRLLLFIISLILAVAIALIVAYTFKTKLIVYFLTNKLGVPVTIESTTIRKNELDINNLWIGNPEGSKTKRAFSSEINQIKGSPSELYNTPHTIDEVYMENIFVGVELYSADGKDNNWSLILTKKKVHETKPRPYLIRKFIIRNLSIQLVKANGEVQNFPVIKEMVFYNISDETGFPIKDIEKALFNLVLKEVFKKIGLEQLMNTIVPSSIPLKYVPFFK